MAKSGRVCADCLHPRIRQSSCRIIQSHHCRQRCVVSSMDGSRLLILLQLGRLRQASCTCLKVRHTCWCWVRVVLGLREVGEAALIAGTTACVKAAAGLAFLSAGRRGCNSNMPQLARHTIVVSSVSVSKHGWQQAGLLLDMHQHPLVLAVH
jgi:hypothetical protein